MSRSAASPTPDRAIAVRITRSTLPDLEPCPHCREMKQVHHVCPTCGWYGGREAIKIKAKKESSAS